MKITTRSPKRLMALLALAAAMTVAGASGKTLHTANLLNNGSFETCGNPGLPDYWGTYHWGMWDELGAARFDQWSKQWKLDSTQHFDGQYSVRLSNDASVAPVPHSLFLTSCQIHLEEPGDHVFSVYMKSDNANTPVVLEIFNGYLGALKSEEVMVGTEWRRYAVTHKIEGDMATASLHLKNRGVVWADAAQFEKGTQPTAFARSFLDEPPKLGEVTCAPISRKPLLDGTLSDAQWKKAEPLSLKKAPCGSEKAGAPTEVRLLADAENLYVGVKCVQPQMAKISFQPKPHDQLLWRPQDQLRQAGGDVVELFISPSPDAKPYYHLVFDAVGNRYEGKSGNAGWDGIWQVKTARSADGWTAEAVIPWSNFTPSVGKTASTWRFNVCRENPYQAENLSLFPTYGTFHTLSRLGKLSGIPAKALNSGKLAISGMTLKACAPDRYVAAVKLFNPTGRTRTLALDAALAVSDRYNGVSREAQAALPPHGSADVEFPAFDFKASARFAKLTLSIRENGLRIASEVQNLTVVPFLELSVTPDRSFYTSEKQLSLTAEATSKNTALAFELRRDGKTIRNWKGVVGQPSTLELQDLAAGKYEITVALTGAAGEKITDASHPFIKLSPAETEVKIEYPAGGLVLNGSPFLPIAVFWQSGPLNQDILTAIKQLGFNTVAPMFPVGVAPEAIKTLERIQVAGLKCIPVFNIKEATAENLEALRTMMDTAKGSPAIIAWMVLDEPELIAGDNERIAKEIYAVAKAADPRRPVYINYTTHTKFNRELPTDINSVDVYPIPEQDIDVYPEVVDDMKASGKAAWLWLQGAGNAYFYYREPTVDEFDFMTLASLLKGDSGVGYFAHLPHSAPLRQRMPELFDMIGAYAPIFLSPPVAGAADAETDGALMTAWRRYDGKTYLLALNTAAATIHGELDTRSVPGAKAAFSLRDQVVIPLPDGKLRDSFKAFQFKIYQVGAPPSSADGNLVLNGGFEIASNPGLPDGWGNGHFGIKYPDEINAAALVRAGFRLDASEKFQGATSFRLSNSSTGRQQALYSCWIKLPAFVVARDGWCLSAVVKANPPSKVKLELLTSGNVPIGGREFDATGEFQRFYTTIKTKNSPVIVRVSGAPGATCWIDDVQLERGSTPSEWTAAANDQKLDLATVASRKLISKVDPPDVLPKTGLEPAPKVELRHKFLFVNDKPFYPYGICMPWGPSANEENLRMLQATGFNVMVFHASDLKFTKESLDLALTAGLFCVPWLTGPDERAFEIVKALKNHPALLYWMAIDEPPEPLSPKVMARVNRIKELDPNHPTYVNNLVPSISNNLPRLAAMPGEIISADEYPVGNLDFPEPLSAPADLIANMDKALAASKKSPMYWLQIMGNAFGWSREPTPEEFEGMVYSSCIAGARGLYFFENMPWNKQLFENAGKLGLELASLAPVLASMEVAPKVTCSSAAVRLTCRVHEGKLYLICVNASGEPVKAEFSADATLNGKVQVLFEGRTLKTVAKTAFSDDLAGYQRRVYSVAFSAERKSTTFTPTVGQTEDDSRLRFLGRTLRDAATGSVTLDWTASGVEFSFNGTEVAAEMVGSTADPRNVAYLTVFVDDVRKNTFMVDDAPKKYILCTGLPPQKHLVRIVKASEAQLSRVKLAKIHLNGELLAKPAAKSRKIEFIGDSITCGYGNQGGKTVPFSGKTEDGLQTWATIAARNLGADCQLICASGYGVVRDCSRGTRSLIPPLYEKSNPFSDPNRLWDFSQFTPDVVVINLGTNDWGGGAPEDEFIAGAVNFIKAVRKHNPKAKIVWAYGLMVKQYAEFIQKAVEKARADDDQVYFVPMTLQNAVDGTGADGHPSVKTHEKAGAEFAAALKGIMGW